MGLGGNPAVWNLPGLCLGSVLSGQMQSPEEQSLACLQSQRPLVVALAAVTTLGDSRTPAFRSSDLQQVLAHEPG